MTKIIIVNEKDEIIGLKERDRQGIDGYRRVSGLWLSNSNGEVLLAQRSFNKKLDPGKWGPAAAGTVEEGETYESNIIKEAKEEIGLKEIKLSIGPKFKIDDAAPRFTQFYLGRVDQSIDKFVIQKEEVEQIKWMPIKELEMDLKKNPRQYTATISLILESLYKL